MKRSIFSYDLLLAGFISFIGLIGLIYFQFIIDIVRTGQLMFPKLSCLFISIFGILTLIDSIGKKPSNEFSEVNILSVSIFMLLSILYVVFLLKIGMITATFLFFLISFTVLSPVKGKDFKQNLIYSILISSVMWIVFIKVFKIILPEHLLF